MLRTKLLSLALIAAAVTLPTQAVFASAVPEHSTLHAFVGKEKVVKFSLRNQGTEPVDLKVGNQTLTLAPGKTMDVKLPVGTRIITASATSHTPANTFILDVSSAYTGAVVSVS
jgi:hypothetical protein